MIHEDEHCEEQVILDLQQNLELGDLLGKIDIANMTPEEKRETNILWDQLEIIHLKAKENLKKRLGALN